MLIAVLVGAPWAGGSAGGLGTFVGALIGIPVGGAIQVIVRELRRGPTPWAIRSRKRRSVAEPVDI